MKRETTLNELVIQGIIKEAFFNETSFNFAANEGVCVLIINDLIESKIRDHSSNKKICFYPKSKWNFKSNKNYQFQAKFHRYTISGELTFDIERDGSLLFNFPVKLILENLRKADRAKVKANESRSIPVFLRSHALHCEGSFILEDTSAQGYGGKLLVPSQFPIETGTTVSGELGYFEGIGELGGEIVSASLLLEKHMGYDTYRIGISQNSHLRKSETITTDRRVQTRHKTNLQLNLESLLHPGQNLILDIDDISVNGFSGAPSIGSIISSVPIGAAFKIATENTKAKLVHFSNKKLHFQILGRSAEDGISWIKKMTPFIYPGVRCTSKDAKELYRIFLQAGAISNQYLKRHHLHESVLVEHGGSGTLDSGIIHRWFVGGTDTESDAYISAIRVANSCWVLGDIAKVNGTDTNVRKVVKSFFQSFSEFALSDASISTLMIFWVKDHPMWQTWHQQLKTKLKHLLCSEVKMQYFRIKSDQFQRTVAIRVSTIQKEDYAKRAEILSNVSENIKKVLTYAFDFDEPGAGSFALKQASRSFERTYSIIETENSKYLTIINRVQFGLSINRFMDSLFVIPIILNKNLVSLEQEVLGIAKCLAIESGIVFPSVRILHEGDLIEGTEMNCLLLYPRAFQSFE